MLALQVLYQMEHGGADAESALQSVAANFGAPGGALSYARELLKGIEANLPEIDRRLDQVSRRWRLERMSRVDRNILRLAGYEIIHRGRDIPPKVAISEGVELAKRFGGDDSPGFVNAVLDSLWASLDPGRESDVPAKDG